MKYASRLLIRTQTWALIIEFTTLAVVDSSLRPTCADSEVVLQKSCSVLLKGVGRGERAVRGFESTRPKVCQAPAPNDDGERRRRLVHSPPALEPPPPPPVFNPYHHTRPACGSRSIANWVCWMGGGGIDCVVSSSSCCCSCCSCTRRRRRRIRPPDIVLNSIAPAASGCVSAPHRAAASAAIVFGTRSSAVVFLSSSELVA